MKVEDKIKYWEKISQDIDKLKALQATVINEIKEEIMPYAIGMVILCKGKYHTNKPCTVIKYHINKSAFTWTIRIVARCIGDAGQELGPTDWGQAADYKLQEVADLLNQISPPDMKIKEYESEKL